jgi:cytochrome c-type biogenesis protein
MELNILISFGFGVLSFFSPCVLPIVPGFFASFSLEKNNKSKKIWSSLQFVLGFSFVFISLGALATSLGSFFTRNSSALGQVSGVVIILFGLFLLFPNLNTRYFYGENIFKFGNINKFKFLIMGFAFGFGFTPCIGPVLGALLALSSNAETINIGVTYLLYFSLGMGLPFLISGFLIDKINLNNSLFRNIQKYSSSLSGLILISIGFLIFTDRMYILASFFQDLLLALNLDRLINIYL